MLPFSDLKKIAKWKPVAPGFGRDEANTYSLKVLPIFEEIENLKGTEIWVITDGSLSNYASAFVHDGKSDFEGVQGLYVYLSLLAPIAAIGRGNATASGTARGYCMIEPAAVLDAASLQSAFEKAVGHKIESGGYKLLSVEDATTELPIGVEPYEYCLNTEPWNRVFHALFSDTD